MRLWQLAMVLWILVMGMVLLILGCAHVEPPAVEIPPLPLLPATTEEIPAPMAPADDQVRRPFAEPVWPQEPGVKVVTQANKRATLMPASVGFKGKGGMLVYPYRPYAIYQADVSCQGSLHIQLQAGEEIRLVSGLQPEQWMVQREDAKTSLESSHLAVTPALVVEQGHHTPVCVEARGRMTLVTAQAGAHRVYYLSLASHQTHGLYGVSWEHPPTVPR